MRYRIYLTLVVLLFLACSPFYACAAKPYTGSYTLSATSPADDYSTGAIEARPGMAIAIRADATGTYSGPIALTLPDINVNLIYELRHDGAVVDTKRDNYPISSMRVEPGKTYSQKGSRSYTLPSDLAPGDYILDCTADVSVFGIGRTEHASFPVKVLADPAPGVLSSPGHADAAETPSLDATIKSCDMWHFPVLD